MAEARNTPVKAAVIGAGAWGTTLARLLAQQGFSVRIWAYEHEVVDAIRVKHENTRFLPGVCLPETLAATGSLEQAVDQVSLIVFAVPSHAARSVLQQLAPLLTGHTPLISVTKGIEEDTLLLMAQVMQETLLPAMHASITVLSGPSFAAEVCKGLPTAVTLAGEDAELVRKLQSWLMTPAFRVYAATDLIGVQLGGALKNVMAIAAGIVDGLGLGHNARAALVTRGLSEMIRLGTAMGADLRTFYGLSGVGDLVLTCTGTLSRNHAVGVRLGQGESLERILADFHAVAEGVRTARAAWGLADKLHVEMPIAHEVCQVLFEGKLSQQSVADLMERAAKDEIGTYAR